MFSIPLPPAWTEQALCAETYPDAFWPEKGDAPMARAAIRICRTCPVKAECLDYALANYEDEGIWGGLSARQRRGLKRAA